MFDRNPATGALVEQQLRRFPAEARTEGSQAKKAKKTKAAKKKKPRRRRIRARASPGLNDVSVVAVSGDGSSVYTIGSGSAAIFSRDPATGKLTETSCAADEDSRCTSLPSLQGVSGAAVSPDGREVYVVAAKSDAVMVFGIGAAVDHGRAPRPAPGPRRYAWCARPVCGTRAAVALTSPGLSTEHGRAPRPSRARPASATSVAPACSRSDPASRRAFRVRLTPAARRLLLSRRHLRLMAVVLAAPSAGGSGYGRHVVLRLGRPESAAVRASRPSLPALPAPCGRVRQCSDLSS